MSTSLVAAVAAIVAKSDQTTMDEVERLLPEYSREQLQKALQNARQRNLVRCLIAGRGGRNGGRPSVWTKETQAPAPRPAREREISRRPPNSAWELSHSRQLLGEWPPAFPGARQFAKLGPWTSPDV